MRSDPSLAHPGFEHACHVDMPGCATWAWLFLQFGVTGRTAIDNTPFRAEFSGTLEKLLVRARMPAIASTPVNMVGG